MAFNKALSSIVVLSIFILSFCVFADESKFESSTKLGELWQAEQIYFQPKNKNDLMNWTGNIYHYSSNKCYELDQKDTSGKVTSKEKNCDSVFLNNAKKPYAKISDFKKYEARILECLAKPDQNCLRGLISKTLQVSFGVDGLQDRRDYIFETWKTEDFKRLHDLIKKGSVGEGDSRTFPPNVANEGMGYRGEFKKESGGWLLKSFLAGD
jgi:hypothetical protein